MRKILIVTLKQASNSIPLSIIHSYFFHKEPQILYVGYKMSDFFLYAQLYLPCLQKAIGFFCNFYLMIGFYAADARISHVVKYSSSTS